MVTLYKWLHSITPNGAKPPFASFVDYLGLVHGEAAPVTPACSRDPCVSPTEGCVSGVRSRGRAVPSDLLFLRPEKIKAPSTVQVPKAYTVDMRRYQAEAWSGRMAPPEEGKSCPRLGGVGGSSGQRVAAATASSNGERAPMHPGACSPASRARDWSQVQELWFRCLSANAGPCMPSDLLHAYVRANFSLANG